MSAAIVARELPILFSAPMVRSILAGRKGQTRRVIKGAPTDAGCAKWAQPQGERWKGWAGALFFAGGTPESRGLASIRCPYGAPGDRLWCRETWAYVGPGSGSDLPDYVEERQRPENHTPRNCWYRADGERGITWTPSIHMPKWASRLSLDVLNVRVERLQAITEADARAEGAELAGDDELQDGAPDAGRAMSYRAGFVALWDSINGRREGCAWRDDPWIWRIEFRRVAL